MFVSEPVAPNNYFRCHVKKHRYSIAQHAVMLPFFSCFRIQFDTHNTFVEEPGDDSDY